MDQTLAIVLSYVKACRLGGLASLFKILAERLHKERKSNEKGCVPKELFEYCIGIGGMSVSVQIVNEVFDRNGEHVGFALQQRDPSKSGDQWIGLYHSPCTTGLMPDTPESMLNRNTIETFGKIPERDYVEFLGITIHDEPERWSSCLTVMHRRKVSVEQVAGFIGMWKIFTDIHDPEIIDHNQYLLEWVSDLKRPRFADVRGGWKPK